MPALFTVCPSLPTDSDGRNSFDQAVAVADPFIAREVLHSTELDKKPNTGYWIVTELMSAHGEPNLVSSESTAYVLTYLTGKARPVLCIYLSGAFATDGTQTTLASALLLTLLEQYHKCTKLLKLST